MLIENTELEYIETDAIALDYYLCDQVENKIDWAQRVWENCRLCYEGEEVASVYKTRKNQTWKERAIELWENKKKRRREAITKEFKKENTDQNILQIQLDPNYKTATQKYNEATVII